jgi:hypothetical protein
MTVTLRGCVTFRCVSGSCGAQIDLSDQRRTADGLTRRLFPPLRRRRSSLSKIDTHALHSSASSAAPAAVEQPARTAASLAEEAAQYRALTPT